MGFLTDWLTDWIKGLLIEGIMGNLTGLFDTVNTRVGEIAVQVGTTPAAWNAGVFSLIRQLSETVILPIAGLILTFVATYELIQLIIEKNNLHDLDYWIFFKWIFKTAAAILILSNTFNIVMAVFDMSQSVIANAAGLVRGSTDISASMLDNLAHNHAHRNPTASLYELGTIYTPTVKDGKADPDVLPHEEKILTLGSYGRLSFFQFKGAIEALLRELNIKGASFAPEKANPSYHPGRCAKVLIDGKEIGVFGTIHPTVADRYGLSGEVLAAELRMDALLAAIDQEKLYHPLPKFPASTRDIAVLVDDAVPAASMQAAVEKAAGKLLESVKLFDVYKGKGIPDGKKSVAYSLSMRAPDRTLTDEECDKAMRAAISALETEFGAQLRG
mgnify:CR=1 FL=1